MAELSPELFSELLKLDTPTVCNALEVVNPDRRARGFTIKPLVCAHPNLPPVLGYARTARITSAHKPEWPQDSDGYYSYIAEGGPVPSIVVVQDIDETVGMGALWGEVNTNLHYGLGCRAVVTNGSIRDLPDACPDFQMLAGMVNPSHAWITVRDWGMTVNVHGMEVSDGDLIHADQHGAVVVPLGDVQGIIETARKIAAREEILISAAKEPGFNMEKLRQAWKGIEELH